MRRIYTFLLPIALAGAVTAQTSQTITFSEPDVPAPAALGCCVNR